MMETGNKVNMSGSLMSFVNPCVNYLLIGQKGYYIIN